MRKWVSVVVLATLLYSDAASAANPPVEVYNDFAEDGVLNCGHSRSALKGALNDASLHQYGDPFTFLGLKLAIRKQLAGGCQRQGRTAVFFGPPARGDRESPPAGSDGGVTKPSRGKTETRPRTTRPSLGEPKREAAGTSGQDGWMVVLGIALLLMTLGSGGWAARRAFTDQP